MTESSSPPSLDGEHPTGAPESLSAQIAEIFESIAAFQSREHQKLGDSQRWIGSVGDIVGRPGYLLSLLSLIGLWIGANGLGPQFGWSSPLDPPPFAWLQGFLTLAGLVTATVVLIEQYRNARLDSPRAPRSAAKPAD